LRSFACKALGLQFYIPIQGVLAQLALCFADSTCVVIFCPWDLLQQHGFAVAQPVLLDWN
jgi:hypothetical protein